VPKCKQTKATLRSIGTFFLKQMFQLPMGNKWKHSTTVRIIPQVYVKSLKNAKFQQIHDGC